MLFLKRTDNQISVSKMDFSYFHDYNRMVRRGDAVPLACPDCNQEYALRVSAFTDEPYFQCFVCGTSVKPGARVYGEIVKEVDRYYNR